MRKAIAVVVSGLAFTVVCVWASADELAKSGVISINSGWKANGETLQVAEGRVFGWGSFYGVTFNTQGSGREGA